MNCVSQFFTVFGKWLEMTNDSNDKWQMTCHFIAQMTNDLSHLNVMLAGAIVLACIMFYLIFFLIWLNHMIRILTNQNQMTEMTKWQRIMNNDKWIAKSFKWSNDQVISEHWLKLQIGYIYKFMCAWQIVMPNTLPRKL